MADETELVEYATSIAANTAELVAVTDVLKDALIAVLANEEDCAVAIASAKETRDALIRDTYRIGLVPFMQPAAEEEPDEVQSEEETAAGSGDAEAGDMGDAEGAKRGRR